MIISNTFPSALRFLLAVVSRRHSIFATCPFGVVVAMSIFLCRRRGELYFALWRSFRSSNKSILLELFSLIREHKCFS